MLTSIDRNDPQEVTTTLPFTYMDNRPQEARILIVEDDPVQTLLLKQSLKNSNYEIIYTKDACNALQVLKTESIDLVLCDWMMPGVTGIELCHQVKSDPDLASVIFILLTGKTSIEDQVFGLESGADDFLNKPIIKNHLLARIHAGLRQKKLYDQLAIANHRLKETQAQLVQTKKMSSLSVVIAGLAHEINNPNNFISGNLKPIEEYFEDLSQLLQLYQEHYPNPPQEITEFIEEIELDYLLEDLPQTLASIHNGSSRISEIISSMRTFVGLDEADLKAVNLNHCIDNILSIIRQRLREKEIQVNCQYADLVNIYCHARNINQALMHIFLNAIDAIEEKRSKSGFFQGDISVTTEYVEDADQKIKISIFDNGMGVAPEVFDKIFDPFFTTKDVGKGIGMGLSVAYRIVQQHSGEIFCNSYPGVGAEFVVLLPLRELTQTGTDLLLDYAYQ